MKDMDHYWPKNSAMENISKRVENGEKEGVSMLEVGREKTTDADRLNNPSWDRAIDSEQSRMLGNKVNIRAEDFSFLSYEQHV